MVERKENVVFILSCYAPSKGKTNSWADRANRKPVVAVPWPKSCVTIFNTNKTIHTDNSKEQTEKTPCNDMNCRTWIMACNKRLSAYSAYPGFAGAIKKRRELSGIVGRLFRQGLQLLVFPLAALFVTISERMFQQLAPVIGQDEAPFVCPGGHCIHINRPRNTHIIKVGNGFERREHPRGDLIEPYL